MRVETNVGNIGDTVMTERSLFASSRLAFVKGEFMDFISAAKYLMGVT